MRIALRRTLLLSPLLLYLLGLIFIPLIIMGYISLLPRNLYGGVDWSGDWQLSSYIRLFLQEDFDGNLEINWIYGKVLLRSLFQASGTTTLCFVLGFPVALWISGLSPRTRNLMVLAITIPFWTNLLIRNYAWLIILREHGLIAQGINALAQYSFPNIGHITLLYNDFAVCIGLLYSFLPFMILPVYAVLEKLDWRLVEAAHDLGATRIQALCRVILPLALPGIVAGSLLVFIPSFGAFITPAILGGGKALMVGNLIQQQFATARNWPFGAALSFLLLAILLLALLLLTRYSRKTNSVVRVA